MNVSNRYGGTPYVRKSTSTYQINLQNLKDQAKETGKPLEPQRNPRKTRLIIFVGILALLLEGFVAYKFHSTGKLPSPQAVQQFPTVTTFWSTTGSLDAVTSTIDGSENSISNNISIGSIDIPNISVQAPIEERGTDNGKLVVAPGYTVTHYMFSAFPGTSGNTIIYGHDDIEGQVFRNLGNLSPGQPIYINLANTQLTFHIQGIKVVSPNDTSVLAQTTTPTLTLITCTPYWVDTQRIVVTATLGQ